MFGHAQNSSDFLAAIEESHFEALPGRVYAIGYVRSYAAYLGLDAEKLVDRLKAEIAAREPAKDDPAIDLLPQPERKLPQGGRVIAGLVLAALIYSGYYFFALPVRRRSRPSFLFPHDSRLAGLTQKPIAEPPPATVEQRAPILPLPEPIEYPLHWCSPRHPNLRQGFRRSCRRDDATGLGTGIRGSRCGCIADPCRRAGGPQSDLRRSHSCCRRYLSRSEHGRVEADRSGFWSRRGHSRRQFGRLRREGRRNGAGFRSTRRTSSTGGVASSQRRLTLLVAEHFAYKIDRIMRADLSHDVAEWVRNGRAPATRTIC